MLNIYGQVKSTRMKKNIMTYLTHILYIVSQSRN